MLTATRTSNGDAANDTIIGDDLVDVVYGREGADTIRGGAAADYLNGDEGNDTFQFANGEVVSGEIVNGGANFDRILALADDVSFVDATVTSIEEIRVRLPQYDDDPGKRQSRPDRRRAYRQPPGGR